MAFLDRADAGRRLAAQLDWLRGQDAVIVGLPRGGVPVAFPIAKNHHCPLDVLIVRKLGAPAQPEVAVGAIGEAGIRVINHALIRAIGVTNRELSIVEAVEQAELTRRAARFRWTRPRESFTERLVVIVDDGMATGSTALAACQVARAHGAKRIIVAVPVAPVEAVTLVRGYADDVVSLLTPSTFHAVGQYYDDFRQTSDEEVIALLRPSPRR